MAVLVNPTPPDLAALTAAMAPRIRRLAVRLCGPDAEDGCQEVHAEIARSLPGFRGEAAPTTWAHRIAVRTLARFARRRRARHEREPNASDLALDIDSAAVAGFMHEPFTRLAARERTARVRDAIDALSPLLRDALVLRVLEDLSYSEIATALELPLGTVKSRIAAATLRLAERLQIEGED